MVGLPYMFILIGYVFCRVVASFRIEVVVLPVSDGFGLNFVLN